MLRGIDHFIIASADPDRAATELERSVGLRSSAGGRHAAHGTFNRLVWLSDTYIELMGVFDRRLAAGSWFGRQALAVLERSEVGYMGLVLASDDLVADQHRLAEIGSPLGVPEAGERLRPDGRTVRWWLAHAPAADPELGLLFLIEHDVTGAEWTPEDRQLRSTEIHPLGGPGRLLRVELPVHDMKSVTMRLHRDLGLAFRPSLAGAGAREASVGSQAFRLVRGGTGVLPTVVLRGGSTRRDVVALGCRWLIEPQRLKDQPVAGGAARPLNARRGRPPRER